jgi:hypothetical protein
MAFRALPLNAPSFAECTPSMCCHPSPQTSINHCRLNDNSFFYPSPLSGPVVSATILHVTRMSSDHHRRAITLHASVDASFLSHFRLWLRSGTHLLSLATLRGCHWLRHFLCAPDDTSFHDSSPLSRACPPSNIVPLVNGTSELHALKAPYSSRCPAVYRASACRTRMPSPSTVASAAIPLFSPQCPHAYMVHVLCPSPCCVLPSRRPLLPNCCMLGIIILPLSWAHHHLPHLQQCHAMPSLSTVTLTTILFFSRTHAHHHCRALSSAALMTHHLLSRRHSQVHVLCPSPCCATPPFFRTVACLALPYHGLSPKFAHGSCAHI